MGRGGGKSGGGMSRGGSRGFSSSRSSSGSSRGGSSFGSSGRGGGSLFGGSSRRTSPPPSSKRNPSSSRRTPPPPPGRMPPPPPRPRRYRTYGPTTVFVDTSGRRRTAGTEDATYRRSAGNAEDEAYRRSAAGTGTSGYSGKKKAGIPGWYKVLCIFMAVVVISLLVAAANARSAAQGNVTREKLGADACISTDKLIDDELDWITDMGTVKKGMDYFYDKTGVQPYLLICDNMDGKGEEITDDEAEGYLRDLYDSMYSDEGHMIFAFLEYEPSEYITFLYTGRSADSVIDADARGIFLDNADRYYTDTSLPDEEFFAKTFRSSADTIMEDAAGNAKSALTYVIASIVLVVIMVCGLICFKIAEQKRREAEEMRQILNTPVGSTEYSPEEEDLINKYSDENQGGNN